MVVVVEARLPAEVPFVDHRGFAQSGVGTKLSGSARSELFDRAIAHAEFRDGARAVTALVPSPGFSSELLSIAGSLDENRPLAVFSPPMGNPLVEHVEVFAWLVATALGDPLVQDLEGRRLVRVFDRRLGSMASGARYHRTRDGGDIHTDNVNDPATFEFVVLACGARARIGGESIFVRASDLFEVMTESCPDVIAVLQSDYLFERRGMSENEGFYRHPILRLDEKGRPHFRYLRTYIESAHRRAQQPLTEQQAHAMDVLDAILATSELQLRIELAAGEIAIFRDTLVLHGRTPFVDCCDPMPGDQKTAAADAWMPGQRVYFRAWVKQNAARAS